MDITPELAEKVLRGGTDAIAVVRGIYQTQIQKLDAIEKQASQMLEAAEMLPLRWIPVSERLPETPGMVILADAETVSCGWFYKPVGWSWAASLDPCEPTHWMPLPEPPEKP